jgi:hypothetical protein
MSSIPSPEFQHNKCDGELVVYNGRELVGFIRSHNGIFEALDRHHRAIAVFNSVRAAMRAIAGAP